MKRVFRFVKSLILHIFRGSPKSSQSLIDTRYAICSSCEFLSKKKNMCLLCGCNINQEKILLNKLAWADQKCPADKW